MIKNVPLEGLHDVAKNKHSMVCVSPSDVSYALRILEEAFQASPLTTTSTIIMPLQCALKRNWATHLKKYKFVQKVLDDNKKWHLVMHRGRRTRNMHICTMHDAGHVDTRPLDDIPVYDSDDGGNLSDLFCTFRADAGAGKTMTPDRRFT